MKRYPGLSDELVRLLTKLQQGVQFPAPRSESRLLPLLPESTIAYAAIPNYGDATSRTLKIFRQELQDSAVLRDWWGHGQLAADGPKLEDGLDKFSQVQQYLGDEIVVSATMSGQNPRLLIVSEIRKPGFRQYLQEMTAQLATKSNSSVRVIDLKELATAKDKTPSEELLVLVRPDYVVGAVDIGTLRTFNARLNAGGVDFGTTAFGKRVGQEYRDGITVMAATDVHKILENSQPASKQSAAFQESGFNEMQYLLWDHKTVGGQAVSQMELSFSAPRHGAAAWLAKPRSLGSLDFVSPKAMMVGTVVLSSPAKIFDDAKELAGPANANTFAAIPTFEQTLKISLKDDLLNLLSGEITFELDKATPPPVEWKATLAVKDAKHLQQTLDTLMTAAHFEASEADDGGVAYHTVRIPSGKTTTEIAYALVDGHMVVGSSRDAVAEAVRVHRSGESFGKSKRFLASLPPGHSLEASALFYQDPVAMIEMRLETIMPGLAETLAKNSNDAAAPVIWVYGEEAAIREVSTNATFDAAGVLIGAAIAIPNLLQSKIAANEASAVGGVRTVVTAQITYDATYPDRGYAPNLASLGPDPRGTNSESPEHAGIVGESLASQNCTASGWCTKSGYRFKVSPLCKLKVCKEFVVVATPVTSGAGTRSFCSTSEGVIRYAVGDPLTAPLSVAECKTWMPLQ